MKILHVIADLKPKSGGPPKAALDMCQALVREGHDVSLFTTNLADKGTLDVPLGQPVNINGVKVFYYPYGIFRKWPVSFSLVRAIRDHIQEFDIVEIHSIYMFHTMVTSYYCQKYHIPYLIRPHGSLDPFIRKKGKFKKAIYHFLIENKNLNGADAIHYTAEDERNLAHDSVHIKSYAVVTTLGLNLGDYSDLPPKGCFRSKYPELIGKKVLLSLGRVTHKKGFDLLAKAFGEAAKIWPDIRLVIAGPEDEGYGDQVRRWLEQNGVLDKTIFTGMILGEEKLAAYVDSDLFVLPSYSENFGIVLAEAMACGLPVITTNKVNIWGEIAKAEAGEIINCDATELKNSIINLLDQPDLMKHYAANGRKLVEEKFNWDCISKKLSEDYKEILNRRKEG